ncbi:head-tail connector protein [Curvibacter sp. HBC28]|uniref:Head-tail connector protein n=1 Tax=Curvibacter microcysteis TaxID=3026419 RepID=A0ABT5MCH2_9BURK|nr:head-tail connector protein [Curvibacter sp. HBC28]MDD0814280.1 head-tail connector protein [Curvibacter sp. HBC28]
MGLRRTSMPAIEPVSLAEAKLHLRVDHDDEDTLIGALITAARMDCEERLQRSLITSGWEWTLDAFRDLGYVPRPPLVSVTSLKYVDAAGTQQTLDPSAYRVDAAGDQPGRLEPVAGQWPFAQDRLNSVTVAYQAGYGAAATDVPGPIRQWILLAIGDMFANRERSSDRPAVGQDFADGLLDPFRVWVL